MLPTKKISTDYDLGGGGGAGVTGATGLTRVPRDMIALNQSRLRQRLPPAALLQQTSVGASRVHPFYRLNVVEVAAREHVREAAARRARLVKTAENAPSFRRHHQREREHWRLLIAAYVTQTERGEWVMGLPEGSPAAPRFQPRT